MAKINENLLVKGARGNVGKQFVYRQHGNDTMIVRMPRMNTNASSTEDQLAVRDQFTSAAMYAQGAIQNAELKKEYQKKAPPGKSAYNMAFLVPKVKRHKNTAAHWLHCILAPFLFYWFTILAQIGESHPNRTASLLLVVVRRHDRGRATPAEHYLYKGPKPLLLK